MRKLLMLAAAGVCLLAGFYEPAEAQGAVVCTNCSTVVNQLWSDAEQAIQYAKQLDQYITQLQQYANQITNTISLPRQIYANVQGDITQIRGIINAADLLAGNSGTIINRLSTAGAYLHQAAYLPANIGAQFTMWQTTIANANKTLGKALDGQQTMQTGYAGIQALLEGDSTGAAGQKQAIQASIEASHIVSTQLNQIQASIVAVAQSQATRDDIRAERQAVYDSSLIEFFDVAPLPTTGAQRF
jgi:P-type conjugative transfer protein TrbJ